MEIAITVCILAFAALFIYLFVELGRYFGEVNDPHVHHNDNNKESEQEKENEN